MVSKGMGRGLEGAERGFLVSGVQPKPKEWREVGPVPQVGDLLVGEHVEDGCGGWLRGAWYFIM